MIGTRIVGTVVLAVQLVALAVFTAGCSSGGPTVFDRGLAAAGNREARARVSLADQFERDNAPARVAIEAYNKSLPPGGLKARSWWDNENGLAARQVVSDGETVDLETMSAQWDATVSHLADPEATPDAYQAQVNLLHRVLDAMEQQAVLLRKIAQESRDGLYYFPGGEKQQSQAVEILDRRAEALEARIARNRAILDGGDGTLDATLNVSRNGKAAAVKPAKGDGVSLDKGDVHNAKAGTKAAMDGNVPATVNKIEKIVR